MSSPEEVLRARLAAAVQLRDFEQMRHCLLSIEQIGASAMDPIQVEARAMLFAHPSQMQGRTESPLRAGRRLMNAAGHGRHVTDKNWSGAPIVDLTGTSPYTEGSRISTPSRPLIHRTPHAHAAAGNSSRAGQQEVPHRLDFNLVQRFEEPTREHTAIVLAPHGSAFAPSPAPPQKLDFDPIPEETSPARFVRTAWRVQEDALLPYSPSSFPLRRRQIESVESEMREQITEAGRQAMRQLLVSAMKEIKGVRLNRTAKIFTTLGDEETAERQKVEEVELAERRKVHLSIAQKSHVMWLSLDFLERDGFARVLLAKAERREREVFFRYHRNRIDELLVDVGTMDALSHQLELLDSLSTRMPVADGSGGGGEDCRVS